MVYRVTEHTALLVYVGGKYGAKSYGPHLSNCCEVQHLLEHSDSRFESIHRFILSESIRIESFSEKNRPFDSLVVLQFFLLIYCSLR